jgi:imidazolonepropionase
MAILLTNATLATMIGGYGILPKAAVAIEDDRILWVGEMENLPPIYKALATHDCQGRLLTPGLIDAHTHVIFGGHRAEEFELRLNGASYEDVARAGGGILSTVRATRLASEDALVAASLPRIDMMIASGTMTIEVKSGYGLTIEDELKMLRAARRLQHLRPIRVTTTHLAAHAVPPEYLGRADDYITQVALPSMHLACAEGLIDAVDAFCEGIAFSRSQVERVFVEARKLGLAVKIHAEQLSDLKGAKMAAGYGALSCDHVEYIGPDGVAAMAASGAVAGILPGAFYTLRETQMPPVAAFRAAGVPMMVASDCNPGSAPMTSLTLAMNLACTLFRMTPQEALTGTTLHAARALGLKDRGTVAAGQLADLCLWEAVHPAELSYRIGATPLRLRIFAGQIQHGMTA